MEDVKADKMVERLYYKDKVFKKLFNLMFNDFGWPATEINKDMLRIWKIVSKLKASEARKEYVKNYAKAREVK